MIATPPNGLPTNTSDDESIPDTAAVIAECSTGPHGIRDCINRADGEYQQCNKCKKYAQCVAGKLIKNRPCPKKLVWDNSLRKCEWKSSTCTKPVVIAKKCPTGSAGIKTCNNRPNGDYQGCFSCRTYVTCSNRMLVRDRPCPAGLVWDDNKKRCEYKSATCTKP